MLKEFHSEFRYNNFKKKKPLKKQNFCFQSNIWKQVKLKIIFLWLLMKILAILNIWDNSWKTHMLLFFFLINTDLWFRIWGIQLCKTNKEELSVSDSQSVSKFLLWGERFGFKVLLSWRVFQKEAGRDTDIMAGLVLFNSNRLRYNSIKNLLSIIQSEFELTGFVPWNRRLETHRGPTFLQAGAIKAANWDQL